MNSEICEKVAAFSAALFGLATCSAMTPVTIALGGATAALSVPSIVRAIRNERSHGIAGRAIGRLSEQVAAGWRTWSQRSEDVKEDEVSRALAALDVVLPHIEISPAELMAAGRDHAALARLAAENACVVAPGDYDPMSRDPQVAINLQLLKRVVEGAVAALEGQSDYEAAVAPWFQREVLRRVIALEGDIGSVPSRTAKLVTDQVAQALNSRFGVTLRTGIAPLDPSRVRARPTELLVPRYEVTPFVDRGGIIEEMLTWATQETSERARGRLVVAPGGSGKTRLGIELLRRLQQRGWLGTFLSSRNSSTSSLESLRTLLDARGALGTCVIVDYAESQQQVLRAISDAACTIPEQGGPVRIIALARSDIHWWGLFSRSESASRIFDLAPADQLSEELSAVEKDRLFEASHQAFKTTLIANGVPVTDAPVTNRGMGSASRPLDIAAAAYLAVRGYRLKSSESLFETLHQEERLYWRRALGAQTDDAPEINDLARVVTQITLVQGARDEGVRELIAADSRTRKANVEDLLVALHRLYSRSISVTTDGQDSDEMMLGSLQPDRLGEHVVMSVLAQDHDSLAKNTLLAAFNVPPFFSIDVSRILTTCRRSLRPEHDQVVRDTALTTLNSFGEIVDTLPLEKAKTLFHALPDGHSMGLGELAVAITRHISSLTPRDNSHLAVSERALYLQRMAQRLGYAGKFEDAIDPILSADSLTNDLFKAAPEYSPQRARVLNDLGYHLSNVGRFEEALAAGRGSVKLYRDLIRNNRGEFVDDLALGLNNIAYHAATLGRIDEAVQASREAVATFEALPTAAREEVGGNYALAMFNLADHHWRRNDISEARLTADRALALYEPLAEIDHDLHGRMLASTYSLRSVIFFELGRVDDAVKSVSRAVSIRRQLLKSSPTYFLTPLATALLYRSKFAGKLRPAEALEDAREAIELLTDPRGAPWLSRTEKVVEGYLLQATVLLQLDRRKEARAAFKEARDQYDADPGKVPSAVEAQLSAVEEALARKAKVKKRNT